MTGLCPECLVVWARHQTPAVAGIRFDQAGRPVSNLPRAFCPDCKRPPKRGKR